MRGAANDGISRIHRHNRGEPQATISPLVLNGGVMEKTRKGSCYSSLNIHMLCMLLVICCDFCIS